MSDRTSRQRELDQARIWSGFEHSCRHARLGVCLFDSELRYLYINDWLAELNGHPAAEHLGRTLQEMAPEVVRRITEPICNEVLETGEPAHRIELAEPNPREDGRIRYILASIIPLESKEGEVWGLTTFVQDVTEQKEIEQSLLVEKSLSDAIIEAHPGFLTIVDKNRRIVFWNRKIPEQTGYGEIDLKGHDVMDFVALEDRDKAIEFFNLALHGGRASGEIRGLDIDGSLRPVYMSSTLVKIKGKKHVLTMTIDISKLRVAEKELTDRLDFEALIRELSGKFINLPPDQVDTQIEETLRRLREHLDLDRVSTAEFPPDGKPLRITHSSAGSEIQEISRSVIPHETPWFVEMIRKGKTVLASVPEDLPEIAERERRYLMEEGIRFFVLVPMVVGGEILGAISFVSMRDSERVPDELERRFTLIGEILANAIIRRRKEQTLRNALLEIGELKDQLEADYIYLQEEVQLRHGFEDIIGRGPAIRAVLQQVEAVAPTRATVLILGETGTGKELVARAVHELSPRRGRPLVKVNCAALPANLIESELFGHKRGAYSGADSERGGRFKLADGTSIFLDEIGDLPFETQAKLLRVLQDGEFEPLGSSKTIKVDVRVIAATNRDLGRAVKEGRFREDLWYRLNVYPLEVPPLRDRKEDIALLTQAFLSRSARRLGKTIEKAPSSVLAVLQDYHWPGNVRELENVIERAAIDSPGPELRLTHRPGWDEVTSSDPTGPRTLEQIEREHILGVLEGAAWKVEGKHGAAAILGLHPSTLRARMRKLDIHRP